MLNPKQFSQLARELLAAEGFRVSSSSQAGDGADMCADEIFASHSGQIHTVRWRVLCESSLTSHTPSVLGGEGANDSAAFDADGALVIVDGDVASARRREIVEEFAVDDQMVKIWDSRELRCRLTRHPALLKRYDPGISFPVTERDFEGNGLEDKSVLIVSDGSPLSFQVFSWLNHVCRELDFLTALQYQSVLDVDVMFGDSLRRRHDLILFFLGDSFGLNIPDVMLQAVRTNTKAGGSLILFPFFAWVRGRGLYDTLEHLIPVRLCRQEDRDRRWLDTSRITTKRDIRSLNTDVFIENQYVTVSGGTQHPVAESLPDEFGFIHSFEFLAPKDSGTPIVSDTNGNPLLIDNDLFRQPVLYLNSCTHNCLTGSPLLSPFELSQGYSTFLENVIGWAARGGV